MSEDKVIGLLGYKGRMGGFHLKALQQLQGESKSGPVSIPDFYILYGDAKDGDMDIAAMADKVDAAIIATPTPLHVHHALEFLNKGKPVLIEKPIAMNVAEAELILHAARRGKTVAHVGYLNRFQPAFREMAARISLQSGTLLIRRSNRKPIGEYGGVAIDLATHDIDLLRWKFLQEVPMLPLNLSSVWIGDDRATYQFSALNMIGSIDATYRVNDDTRTRMWYWFGEDHIVLDMTAQTLSVNGEPIKVDQVNQVLEQDRAWLEEVRNPSPEGAYNNLLCDAWSARDVLSSALTK